MSVRFEKGLLSASDITTDLGTSTGTANALAGASLVDTSNTFETGRLYWIKANLANTGATTLAKNGGTAVHIRKNPNSAALAGGEIAANALVLLYFDGTYLQFVAGRALLDSEASSLCTPVVTGGTSTAYTLTDTRIGTPTGGQVFAFLPHTASGATPTLAVNGGTARNLVFLGPSNTYSNLAASQLSSAAAVVACYDATNLRFVVLAGLSISAAGIPSTLGGTTFTGAVQWSGAQSSAGNTVANTWRDSSGNLISNVQSGAQFAWYVNGSNRLNLDGANLITTGSLGVSGNSVTSNVYGCNSGGTQINGTSAGYSVMTGRSTIGTGANGATNQCYAANHATYPGVNYASANLDTRAANTAIALCAVPAGNMARVEILENSIAGCWAHVDAAGTVTLYSPTYGTVNANIVNSSSPSAAQYGVYLNGGFLYFKGGSSYAGKMGSFSRVGQF